MFGLSVNKATVNLNNLELFILQDYTIYFNLWILLISVVKCVLVASPGFVKDQFYEYLFQYAVKMDNKVLLENKSKFLLVHSSSGFKHSLKGI